ncbi:S1/P1 nuclease [Roseivirga sp. BDSF3-8]|uniref:S1/P1 nuclease n=1 Tax=Roseivirga sp. BDSF3-8 TaxID=3241598 RepID=UPI003531AA02
MKHVLSLFFIFASVQAFGWGMTGHRVVGYIAQQYLDEETTEKIKEVLGPESLAMGANWMDAIRSDDAYDHTHDWHWVTVPEGETYESAEKNPHGDVISTIERLTKELKAGGLEAKTEREYLRMLVHLVGDLHQPLHVGTGLDKGGNDVKVEWFWEESNLHRVWDSGMIDSQQLSYTELGDHLMRYASPVMVSDYQATGVREWAMESVALRNVVYDLPENMSIAYEYRYHNWDTVEQRLLQAGIRLAGLLNEIYG